MPLTPLLDGVRRELGFALRQIGKHPGFTAVAVLSLALGLGLNIAMFKVIDSLFLEPLDLPHSQDLYYLKRSTPQQSSAGHSAAGYLEISRRAAGFADLAARRDWGFGLSEPHRLADMIDSGRVSANFFSVLGVQPMIGRDFRPDEEIAGRNNVILITHRFWLSRYGGDPNIIGRTVRLDGASVAIIGVLPQRLERGSLLGAEDLFRPLGLTAEEKTNWQDNAYLLVGRYRPELSPAQTAARFGTLAERLAADYPRQYANNVVALAPLQAAAFDGGGARPITFMLLGLSGFVLLIACANLGNLMLARTVARSGEFAVREALGASRSQVLAPLAAEAFFYALGGGLLGALVSVWTDDWMSRTLAGGNLLHFDFDWRGAAFVAAASLLAGCFCCLGPAWFIGRQRVIDQLKSGGRGGSKQGSHRFRQVLIVGQFALALVLLTGAVFFVQGVRNVLGRQIGWNPKPMVSGTILLPSAKYESPDQILALDNELRRRVAALPGVDAAAISYATPIFPFSSVRKYQVEGRPQPAAGQEPTAYVNGVSPGYFETVGTRILRGRGFDDHDDLKHEDVVVVDQDMARALFPGQDPIGRRIAMVGETPLRWHKIVGVAETVVFQSITPSRLRFELYQPLAQEPWNYVAVSARTAGNPAALVDPIARTLADLDPNIPIMVLHPVTEQIRLFTSDLYLVRTLVVAFAVLGLLLAALGIYGVVAHLVALRTREIGIRMALGAQTRQVVTLVLGGGLRLAVGGALIGLALSVLLLRTIGGALPGLVTNNGAAAGAASVALLAVALFACYMPARRAARIDPMTALREE